MSTYKELYDAALMRTGMVVPVSWLTPSLGLLWMSEYIHNAQALIGIKTCTETINLSATSTTGQYNLSCSIDAVDWITLAPDATSKAFIPVTRMTLDQLHRIIQNWPQYSDQTQANNWYWQDFTIDTSLTYCAPDGCTLNVYPYATPGILTIHYKPLMPIYSKTSPDWSKFGPNPAQAMETTSIPIEFETCASAISAFVCCRIVESQPKGVANYGMQYAQWQNEQKLGMKMLRRRNVGYVQDTQQPTRLGPVF